MCANAEYVIEQKKDDTKFSNMERKKINILLHWQLMIAMQTKSMSNVQL